MRLTPIQKAREMFNQREVNPADPLMFSTFDMEVRCWMHYGYVVSTPTLFVMAKPVDLADSSAAIWDPAFYHAEPNAWLVHTLVGDMEEAWHHIPFVLDYVVYHRPKNGKTLVLNSYRLWQRLHDGKASKTSTTSSGGPATIGDTEGHS